MAELAKNFNFDTRGQKGSPSLAYADDITITSTHTSTSAAKKCIQPYLHKIFAWTSSSSCSITQISQIAE